MWGRGYVSISRDIWPLQKELETHIILGIQGLVSLLDCVEQAGRMKILRCHQGRESRGTGLETLPWLCHQMIISLKAASTSSLGFLYPHVRTGGIQLQWMLGVTWGNNLRFQSRPRGQTVLRSRISFWVLQLGLSDVHRKVPGEMRECGAAGQSRSCHSHTFQHILFTTHPETWQISRRGRSHQHKAGHFTPWEFHQGRQPAQQLTLLSMAHDYKGELKKDLLGGQVNRSFFFFLSCQILQIILLVGVMLQGGENGVPDRK